MSAQSTSVQAVQIQVPAGRARTGDQAQAPVAVGTGVPVQDVQKATASPQPQPTPEELQRATEALQRRFSTAAPELQFSVDRDNGKAVITVTDPATHEIIRQIPSEEAMRISKAIDRLQGLLVDQKS